MEKSVKITLIIVSAVILIFLIGLFSYFQVNPTNTITVNGQATVKAVPDLVSVYFNIETRADTAEEAKDLNSEIVDNVITALIKQGFERKDIVTENFNIYPEYDWRNNPDKILDYRATHSLKVQISTEESDKIGKAIDAGVDSGASINYINFELSQEKQNQYKAEALQKATEDARIKAESIALGLGKKIGNVVSTSTNDFYYYPRTLYENAGEADIAVAKQAVTNIQPGEQDISAGVSVTYKLR